MTHGTTFAHRLLFSLCMCVFGGTVKIKNHGLQALLSVDHYILDVSLILASYKVMDNDFLDIVSQFNSKTISLACVILLP